MLTMPCRSQCHGRGLASKGSAGVPPQPFYQIIGTAKHFIGYDMESGNTNISDRWAAEYYLPQFENAVRAGNVREIMTAHVAVNGVPLTGLGLNFPSPPTVVLGPSHTL